MATSRLLVQRGFRVFGTLLDSDDSEPLERVGVTPVRLDVTQPASVRAASERVHQLLGDCPLAGLVNNAGIAAGGPIELLDLEEMRRVFEVNVIGLVAVTQAFLPRLRQARGRVINISSVSGRLALPFSAPYCGSKFAVEAVSDCLRREMVPFGVEVVVIEPAIVRTPIWDKALQHDLGRYRGTPYESVAAEVERRLRKNRDKGLDPEEVARVIAEALTVTSPPTRIPVLRKRRNHLMALWMPDRLLDRMIARKVWNIP
jgi:NAD(P)-dependent dehydrogenase (short-subunit alcohol dehydrogenase family)